MVEGKKNTSDQRQGYKLSGNLDPDAQAAYMELMAKPLALTSLSGEGEDDNPKGKPQGSPKAKIPVQEQRVKKIMSDLAAARVTLKALEDGNVQYSKEIKKDFKVQIDLLMEASGKLHNEGLIGGSEEGLNAIWETAKPPLRVLKVRGDFVELL